MKRDKKKFYSIELRSLQFSSKISLLRYQDYQSCFTALIAAKINWDLP